MKSIINRVPVPMAGLMLGLASAGNLTASYSPIYKSIFGILSALLLLLLLLKLAVNFKSVKEDLNNPVVAGVAPTFSMGIMILSTYVKPYSPNIAYGMWIAGIVIHLLLMIYFTIKFIIGFNIKNVFPSYFVVYVGIVAASLTAPAFNAAALGRFLFWFGFISYLILLPIIIYRVFKVKAIPEPALPTIAIFAAPGSLCLAGYLSTFTEKSMALVWFMAALSLIMFLGVLVYLPKLLKLKFYPSYSAFTFPFVISAVAIKSTNAFLIKSNIVMPVIGYIARFEEILAVYLVVYVFVRYIFFLLGINPLQTATASKNV